MRTPPSLRIARLLLVGAAAGAFGLFVYIAVLARSVSAPLVLFLLAGVVLVYAAASLAADARRGRLLALSGGLVLAATGVLAGFGAGNLSLPMGALGILAAWAAVLHPPRRGAVIAFAVYLAVGLALTLPRGEIVLTFPWLLSGVLLWPWMSTFLLSGTFPLPIYASIGIALALAVGAFVAPRRPPLASASAPPPPAGATGPRGTASAAAMVLGAGVAATAAYVAWAFARTDTSARAELALVPLAIVLAGGALLGLGIATLRARPAIALAALAAGATIAVLLLLSRPVVTCHTNGVSTSGGPWWMPQSGGSSSGSSASAGSGSAVGAGRGTSEVRPSASTGEIRRSDGVVIRYRCDGAKLVEFTIDRT